MRRNLSGPNLLLNGIRKQRHESKPTGNPTGAPVKLSGQFVEAVSETMLQFSQQPALLHRAGALGCPQRLFEHKSFGFGHGPNGRRYRVTTQLFQCGNAFVAVDHQVAVGLIIDRHNDNRYLLPRSCQ